MVLFASCCAHQYFGNVGLYMRTYAGDSGWLSFSLRAVKKYALSEFSSVTVVVWSNESHFADILKRTYPWLQVKLSDAQTVFEEEFSHVGRTPRPGAPGAGYYAQMFDKMSPHLFVPPNTDFVFHLDSDCIFTAPVNMSLSFSSNSTPIVYYSSWNETSADHISAWRAGTAAAVGVPEDHLPYSFMRIGPKGQVYPRQFYHRARSHLAAALNCSTNELIRSYARKSALGIKMTEFEVLGAYAWLHERRLFDFQHLRFAPRIDIRQYWSWGGRRTGLNLFLECVVADGTVTEECLSSICASKFATDVRDCSHFKS